MTQEQVKALNDMTFFGTFTVRDSKGTYSIRRTNGYWVLDWPSYSIDILYGVTIPTPDLIKLRYLYGEYLTKKISV